mgnify:CR=1 FL=1
MVKLVFSFSTVERKSKERVAATIIESNVEGLIKLIDGEYFVEYKGKLYKVSESSYNSKNKKVVYAKNRDKFNHRIKIIRDNDSKFAVNRKHYIPFADGLMAKGKIIKSPFAKEQFHITSCHNKSYDSTDTSYEEFEF